MVGLTRLLFNFGIAVTPFSLCYLTVPGMLGPFESTESIRRTQGPSTKKLVSRSYKLRDR